MIASVTWDIDFTLAPLTLIYDDMGVYNIYDTWNCTAKCALCRPRCRNIFCDTYLVDSCVCVSGCDLVCTCATLKSRERERERGSQASSLAGLVP